MIDTDTTNDENNTNNENNTVRPNEKYSPFNIHWLDSSYQQTCSSDSPWQKIINRLEPILANKARQHFGNRQRRQILIQLLGPRFQAEYFPFEPDLPHILNPPIMLEENRRKLENEAKSWLQIETYKSAMEIGAAVAEDQSEELSNDMKEFLEYIYQILWKCFEDHLYKIKQQEIKKQQQKFHKEKDLTGLTGPSKYRSILQDLYSDSNKLSTNQDSTSNIHSMSSQYSEIISTSVVSILKHDLRLLILINEKLFGQQLPIKLRQFIWTECLLRLEKQPVDYDLNFVEYQTRRDFAAGVTRGKNELQLKNPSTTPITSVIENAVIEIYSKTIALHSYLEEEHLRLTIKILNVLYTYRKAYELYYIYWLLPFQLSYYDGTNRDESIYVIAMNLNLFIRNCFPGWENIFTITNDIMLDLSINDQNFYEHLKSISNVRKNINYKDFQKEMVSLEGQQADNSILFNDNLLSDPVLFLRKWIGEMFVGILNSNAVLYLWDQFFMMKWNIMFIKHATKAILYLLRDRMMYATDYNDMRKIFLDEPSLLYTSDIQAAFVHLAIKNEDPRFIPPMNQRFYPSKSINANQLVSKKQKTYFETIGIKDISLNLIILSSLHHGEEFKYKSLIVEIQVHGDGEILGVVSTTSIPINRQEQSIQNKQKIKIDIPNEKLIIPIQQVQKSFITGRIQALVLVHQRLNINTLKTLGHCRFPLYIPQKIGNVDTWEVTNGPIKRPLHPGAPPLSIDMISDIPNVFVTDTIGRGSTISLVVFDPKTEQYSYPKNLSR